MTASPPVSSDPLAAANAPAPAAPDPTESNDPAASPARKRSNLALLIGVPVGLLLLLIGGGTTAMFLLAKPEQIAAVTSVPIPADPGVPPPIPQFALEKESAAPQAAVTERSQVELIEALGKRTQARIFVGTGETAVPKEFVVRGGGASDAAGHDLPAHERWSIQFPPGITIEAYTRQLDFFKIELGVIGGSQQVTYLTNLSNPKPRSRVAPGNTDSRIYLIWDRGPLREADEILAARAGLNPEGKVLAHFIPPQLEAEMLRIEAAQAQVNKLTHLRWTAFAIQSAGADTFRMVVAEQKGD